MAERSTDKPTKGWALNSQDDFDSGRLRQSLGGKLWLLSFIILIGLSVAVIIFAASSGKKKIDHTLKEKPVGLYIDNEHRAFTDDFIKLANKRGVHIRAEFISERDFKIIAPCDAAYDEVVFLSRAAALGVWRHFRVKPAIWTYTEQTSSPDPRLTAKTIWSDEKTNFVVLQQKELTAE